MNASDRRRLASLKERLQRNDCEGALRILQPLLPRKATEKSKATRARKRAESAAERRRNEVENAALCADVSVRARGCCELEWAHTHHGHEPHHLLSGSAKKLDEKPENVMWVCRHHHDDYHRHQSRYIEPVKEWAARNGLPVPERILRLERRLASLPAPQAPRSNPGQTHYLGDSCPGGHESERIAK